MATFRRKSTNVEARHYTADTRSDVDLWVRDAGTLTLQQAGGVLVICTPQGTTTAEVGDWIVHDELLGFCVVSADHFDDRFYESGGS